MKLSTKLARALSVIAAGEQTLETKADGVLAIVAKIPDLSAFNTAVKEAYAANGWNAKPGEKGAAATVPATVKQYVSQVRAAFNLGVPVAKMKSMSALRKAVKAARPPATPAVPKDPAMKGLTLVKSGELTGAPFHDLVALYENLNKQKQVQLVGVVERVVRQFQPAAPMLRLAA